MPDYDSGAVACSSCLLCTAILTAFRPTIHLSRCAVSPSHLYLTIILHQCRHYNAINGVTGLLWADGSSFMQVLEGHRDSVDETYSRISADPRHTELVITHEAKIETREFSEWAMAYRWSFEDANEYNERVRYLIRKAKGAARSNIAARIVIDMV